MWFFKNDFQSSLWVKLDVLQFVRCIAGRGVGLHCSLERYWSQQPLYLTRSHCVSTARPRQPVAPGRSDCVRISQHCTIDAENKLPDESLGALGWGVWGAVNPVGIFVGGSTGCCFFWGGNISTQPHKHQCLV